MKWFLMTCLLVSAAMIARADNYDFSLVIDTVDSGGISVSTNPAAPTQILSSNTAARGTWIINTSTSPLWIAGASPTSANPLGNPASISTGTVGSFFIVGGSTTWSPDANGASFRGPLWAVANPGASPLTIERVRVK